MKTLHIGTDRQILDKKSSDTYSRMLLYAPLVDEMYIHCVNKNTESIQSISDNTWIYTCKSWWSSLFVIYKIIKDKNIDVIVTPDPFAKAWVSMLFAVLFRKKLMLLVFGGNIFDNHWKKLSIFNWLYSWIGRIIFWYADAIQTDGWETYYELQSRCGNKVFWKPVVPVNKEDIISINRNTDYDDSRKVNILFVGRLIEQKNIPFLVRVINALSNKAQFTVVGDGVLKSLLPMNSIKYFPVLNRKEIVEQFRLADMLILTSYFEGFAKVMMEAAFSGIPIVSTRVSGVRGLIDNDSNGFVLEQGDEQGFIQAVEKLIQNHDLRVKMGKAIREHANKELSVEVLIERQREIYNFLDK